MVWRSLHPTHGVVSRLTHKIPDTSAELTLFDREQVGGACTADLRQFPRSVTVQFDAVGIASIRVRGRSSTRTSDRLDSLVVFERPVVVR